MSSPEVPPTPPPAESQPPPLPQTPPVQPIQFLLWPGPPAVPPIPPVPPNTPGFRGWFDRNLSVLQFLLALFGVVLPILGTFLVGGWWMAGHFARVEVELGRLDTKISESTRSAVGKEIGALKDELKIINDTLKTDHRANEYAARLNALICGKEKEAMIRLYDEIRADPELSKISKTVKNAIYSKVLPILCERTRMPRLSIAELDLIAQTVEPTSCDGDNRYYLGLSYLAAGDHNKSRDYLLKSLAASYPPPLATNPTAPPLNASEVVRADSNHVALLLICDMASDRNKQSSWKIDSAWQLLQEIPTTDVVVDLNQLVGELDDWRSSAFMRPVIARDALTIPVAYESVRARAYSSDKRIMRKNTATGKSEIVKADEVNMKSTSLKQTVPPVPSTDVPPVPTIPPMSPPDN
jgi:hypothetical protein